MPTFAGSYIKEPSDLQVVCNEATIIGSCDDPGGEAARDIERFADLSVAQKAQIVGVVDSLIRPAEAIVNSYARGRGYAIPLSPVDLLITDITARLVWISMRQRAGRLTGEQAEAERKAIREGQLRDIATGKAVLTAAVGTGAAAPSANVYAASSANQRDTTLVTERLTRASLGVLG